jgi:hypothetical protein
MPDFDRLDAVSGDEPDDCSSGTVAFSSAGSFIIRNPFRILGVYASSPVRDREANKSKINAFARVSKTIDFPADFSRIFGPVDRTGDAVAMAISSLATPSGLIKAAQFWFVDASHPDRIAFRHLAEENIREAKAIWSRVADMSACQNMTVLELASGNLGAAAGWADRLYSSFPDLFVQKICGDTVRFSRRDLILSFLDTCAPGSSAAAVLKDLPSSWVEYVAEKAVPEIAEQIKSLVSGLMSRSEDWKDCRAALDDFFRKLDPLLTRLCQIYPADSLKVTSITDAATDAARKVCVAWFNGADSPREAVVILDYARRILSVPAGKISRSRTEDNIRQLEERIQTLPPEEVECEYSSLLNILRQYDAGIKTDDRIIRLIGESYPFLSAIKQKCGDRSSFYIRLSDQVAVRVMNYINATYTEQLLYEIDMLNLHIPGDYGFDAQRRKVLGIVRTAESIFRSMYGKVDISSDLAENFNTLKFGFDAVASAADISYPRGIPSLIIVSGNVSSKGSCVSAAGGSYSPGASGSSGGGCFSCILFLVALTAGMRMLWSVFV